MTNASAEAATPTVILAQTGFFRDLNPRQLGQVATLSEMQEWPEGHQVYAIGEAGCVGLRAGARHGPARRRPGRAQGQRGRHPAPRRGLRLGRDDAELQPAHRDHLPDAVQLPRDRRGPG